MRLRYQCDVGSGHGCGRLKVGGKREKRREGHGEGREKGAHAKVPRCDVMCDPGGDAGVMLGMGALHAASVVSATSAASMQLACMPAQDTHCRNLWHMAHASNSMLHSSWTSKAGPPGSYKRLLLRLAVNQKTKSARAWALAEMVTQAGRHAYPPNQLALTAQHVAAERPAVQAAAACMAPMHGRKASHQRLLEGIGHQPIYTCSADARCPTLPCCSSGDP